MRSPCTGLGLRIEGVNGGRYPRRRILTCQTTLPAGPGRSVNVAIPWAHIPECPKIPLRGLGVLLRSCFIWWLWVDSNHRPQHYESLKTASPYLPMHANYLSFLALLCSSPPWDCIKKHSRYSRITARPSLKYIPITDRAQTRHVLCRYSPPPRISLHAYWSTENA